MNRLSQQEINYVIKINKLPPPDVNLFSILKDKKISVDAKLEIFASMIGKKSFDVLNNNNNYSLLMESLFVSPIITKFLMWIGTNPAQKNKKGNTFIFLAFQKYRDDIIFLEKIINYCYITNNININHKNSDGLTILETSIMINCHKNVINHLIYCGANLSKITGTTLINVWRKSFHDFELLKFLVDKGLNIKYKTKIHGLNIIMILQYYVYSKNEIDFKTIMKFLIMKGIDINEKDNYGNNILLHAASITPDYIMYLLEYNIDLSIVNNRGKNIISLLEEKQQQRLIEILLFINPLLR